jgi:hypothetical protein
MAKAKEVDLVEDEDDLSIIEFSENIADAEAPDPLPERDYPASISKVSRETSGKGGTYAAVSFHVNEEDYPSDFDAAQAPGGKEVRHVVMLTDDAPTRHRVRKFCEAIGANMGKRINLSEWIGLQATITIKHDTYEGVKREKVGKVEPA